MDRILLEFTSTTGAATHVLRLHAQPVEEPPSLFGDDRLYLQTNTGPGAETRLGQTLAAIGALWSAYYPSAWSLALQNLWQMTAGQATPLFPLPGWGPVTGALVGTPPPGFPTCQRRFRLYSRGSYRRHLWLRQMEPAFVGPRQDVTPTTGGYDSRDQLMMAYLSGPVTALLAPDGTPFRPEALVSAWYDRPYA